MVFFYILCIIIFVPSETGHNDLPAAHQDHCGEKRGFEPGVASSAVWRANNEPPHLSFWSVLAVFLLLLLTVKSIDTVSLKPKLVAIYFLICFREQSNLPGLSAGGLLWPTCPHTQVQFPSPPHHLHTQQNSAKSGYYRFACEVCLTL